MSYLTAAIFYTRCTCIDTRHAQKASRKWSLEMDVALVQYINRLCRHLAITPARLHPHEVYLDPGDTADPRVACLLSKLNGRLHPLPLLNPLFFPKVILVLSGICIQQLFVSGLFQMCLWRACACALLCCSPSTTPWRVSSCR